MEDWQVVFGPFLVLVVLFARGGLIGLSTRIWRRFDHG
jgi:ABC-type branched-subunit amino acid transport system permease subunit